MRMDWWTLGLQTINLLVLLWLLGRFLFRPMADIIAQRQAQADKLLDDARAAQDRAHAAEQAAKDEEARTVAARSAVLEQARRDAEAQRGALIEAARKDAAAQQAAAAGSIAQERAKAQADLERDAGQLAVDIAARLLDAPASGLPLDAFLHQFETAIAALPEATRAAIGADGAAVSLTSARDLDEAARGRVTAAVTHALGRSAVLEFAVDRSLIAGLRLEGDLVQIDASLRADLERIRMELTHHAA